MGFVGGGGNIDIATALFLEPTAFMRGDPELEPRRKPDLPLTSLALVRGLADSSFFPPPLKPRC